MKIKIITAIHKAVLNGKNLHDIEKKLRGVVSDIPDLNIREKAVIYSAARKITIRMLNQHGEPTNTQIKEFITSYNKAEEHRNVRNRVIDTRWQLRINRATQQVFLLCSKHSNPAEDHKDWEGKVYVDKYWRNTLSEDEETRKKVAAYIKNHDVKTVQEICGAPVYMTTRPHCKHFFIPVTIEEVLGSSVKGLLNRHSEAIVKNHNINYRKKFYETRKRIHLKLGMVGEARRDTVLINRMSDVKVKT